MKGVIELGEGELDLDKTMQCGQTFCWNKVSGAPLYDDSGPSNTPEKYYSTVGGEIVILWQDGNELHYEATGDPTRDIEGLLRLHEPLEDVLNAIAKDDVMQEAVEQHRGIRLVQDDFVPCLISYLCSPQQRIPKIKEMFNDIVDKYGSEVEHDDRTFTQFPSLYELSNVSERELRRMGLGYRAKYVKSAIRHLIKGKVTEEELREMDYDEAHEEIQQINGVGDKVADCVLLFSLGKMAAFPLDTWAKQAIEEHYPDHHHDDYHKTAEKMREYFGRDYAGYAQEYLFHHIRDQEDAAVND
jgi:N-glycosylase/DNA lyase